MGFGRGGGLIGGGRGSAGPDAKSPAVGNTVISRPHSAITTCAAWAWTPGIVDSSSKIWAWGPSTSSIRSLRSVERVDERQQLREHGR
jgi:hypothetical protein